MKTEQSTKKFYSYLKKCTKNCDNKTKRYVKVWEDFTVTLEENKASKP